MSRKKQLQQLHNEVIVTAVISNKDQLIKQAGLWDMLGFDQAASAIQRLIKQHVVKEDTPEGYLKAFGDLLLTGALFKAHPLLGGAFALAKAAGVDVYGIFISIIDAVQNAINSGRQLSESEFESITSQASTKYSLIKTAKSDIPFLPNKGEKNILKRIFGGLAARKGKMLVTGILVWALKTALLAAGLMVGAGAAVAAYHKFKDDDDEKEDQTEDKSEENHKHKEDNSKPNTKNPLKKDTPKSQKLRPSGKGEKVFKNDENNMWMVPLINNNVEDTVLLWTEEIYPQLSGYDHIISMNPAFKRTISLLETGGKEQGVLLVPSGFVSRKQVVDLFAHEVAEEIL